MYLIDDSAIDIETQLRQLQVKHQAEGNLYLLVDGAFDQRWYLYLKSQPITRWHALFEGRPGADDQTLEVSPLLMAYSQDELELINLLRHTSGKPMLSLIVTTETQHELANRLTPWCVAEVDDTRFNFRFADTRRLPAIIDVLDETQRGQFLGPATAAYYSSRQGTLVPLPLPKISQTPARRIRFTNKQYAALIADSEADEMLDLLSFNAQGLYEKLKPSERHHRIVKGLAQANKYGANEMSAKSALCRLVLEFPNWEDAPQCAELTRIQNPEVPNVWESIATCMQERTATT